MIRINQGSTLSTYRNNAHFKFTLLLFARLDEEKLEFVCFASDAPTLQRALLGDTLPVSLTLPFIVLSSQPPFANSFRYPKCLSEFWEMLFRRFLVDDARLFCWCIPFPLDSASVFERFFRTDSLTRERRTAHSVVSRFICASYRYRDSTFTQVSHLKEWKGFPSAWAHLRWLAECPHIWQREIFHFLKKVSIVSQQAE